MPHIMIEYSANLTELNVTKLMQDCHHALDGLHNIATERVKTRAIKLDHFLVGHHGQNGQMIHVTLKLMTGRSSEARQELARILYDTVRTHLPQGRYPSAALTVEVVELDKETYIP